MLALHPSINVRQLHVHPIARCMAGIVEERGVVGVVHVPQEVAIGRPHLTSLKGVFQTQNAMVKENRHTKNRSREHLQET